MNQNDARTILTHAQGWLGFTAANDLHKQAAGPQNLKNTWDAIPAVIEYLSALEADNSELSRQNAALITEAAQLRSALDALLVIRDSGDAITDRDMDMARRVLGRLEPK